MEKQARPQGVSHVGVKAPAWKRGPVSTVGLILLMPAPLTMSLWSANQMGGYSKAISGTPL